MLRAADNPRVQGPLEVAGAVLEISSTENVTITCGHEVLCVFHVLRTEFDVLV